MEMTYTLTADVGEAEYRGTTDENPVNMTSISLCQPFRQGETALDNAMLWLDMAVYTAANEGSASHRELVGQGTP